MRSHLCHFWRCHHRDLDCCLGSALCQWFGSWLKWGFLQASWGRQDIRCPLSPAVLQNWDRIDWVLGVLIGHLICSLWVSSYQQHSGTYYNKRVLWNNQMRFCICSDYLKKQLTHLIIVWGFFFFPLEWDFQRLFLLPQYCNWWRTSTYRENL